MAPVPNQFANETTPVELVKLDENFAAFQSASGSSLVGFNNGGSGATTRTAEDKMRDTVSVRDFGAIGDGIVNDTAAVQAAFNAAVGRTLVDFNGGIYLVDGDILIPSSTNFICSGPKNTIFKRKNNATSTSTVLACSNTGDISLSGFSIDGNKANNSTAAVGLSVYNGHNVKLKNVSVKNCKGNSGIAFVLSQNVALGAYNILEDIKVTGCDFYGILMDRAGDVFMNSIDVRQNNDGIVIGDLGTFPPAAVSALRLNLNNITAVGNTQSQVSIGRYVDQYLTWDVERCNINNLIIEGSNTVYSGFGYGLYIAARNVNLSNFSIVNCLTNQTLFGAGCIQGYLVNVSNGVVSNNSYGIDFGGSVYTNISNVNFRDNIDATNFAQDINAGASKYLTIANSTFASSNSSATGAAIGAPGIDGGTGALAFAFQTQNLKLENCNFELLSTARYAVSTDNMNLRVEMKDCSATGPAGVSTTAFLLPTNSFVQHGNVVWDSGVPYPSAASASTLIIPDVGEDIRVTGNTQIDRIRTVSQNTYADKVTAINLSASGSGYTSNPTVSFSGGGGSGATATAIVVGGVVRYVKIDNPGSGYTSAPAVAFSGGGGSGAVATSAIGVTNQINRKIRLHFKSNPTVKHNNGGAVGNVLFRSGVDYVASSISVLELVGGIDGNGSWNAVS